MLAKERGHEQKPEVLFIFRVAPVPRAGVCAGRGEPGPVHLPLGCPNCPRILAACAFPGAIHGGLESPLLFLHSPTLSAVIQCACDVIIKRKVIVQASRCLWPLASQALAVSSLH